MAEYGLPLSPRDFRKGRKDGRNDVEKFFPSYLPGRVVCRALKWLTQQVEGEFAISLTFHIQVQF